MRPCRAPAERQPPGGVLRQGATGPGLRRPGPRPRQAPGRIWRRVRQIRRCVARVFSGSWPRRRHRSYENLEKWPGAGRRRCSLAFGACRPPGGWRFNAKGGGKPGPAPYGAWSGWREGPRPRLRLAKPLPCGRGAPSEKRPQSPRPIAGCAQDSIAPRLTKRHETAWS